MSILDHFERYLGPIKQGWKDQESEAQVKVVSFENCPGETVTTFLSLGMSDLVLELPAARQVRQEMLFSAYSLAIPNLIVSCLFSICEAIMRRRKAVLRGEVIPLSEEVSTRIGFAGVYCTIPVLFDDEFSAFEASSPPTVIVWLLPIHRNEIGYIESHGWGKFEELLEEVDPDLYSLSRPSII